MNTKKCLSCGTVFTMKSNNQKYCFRCQESVKKERDRQRAKRFRNKQGNALGKSNCFNDLEMKRIKETQQKSSKQYLDLLINSGINLLRTIMNDLSLPKDINVYDFISICEAFLMENNDTILRISKKYKHVIEEKKIDTDICPF